MRVVTCAKCNREVSESDLEPLADLAVCRECKAPFDVPAADLRAGRDDPHEQGASARISTPPAFSVRFTDSNPTTYRDGVKRELSISWPLEDHAISRASTLVASTFMWLLVYLTFSIAEIAEMALQLILTVATGIPACVITYAFLASSLDRTHLTVTNGLLHVRHEPLPWLGGNKTVPIDRIRRVYCSRNISGRHREFTSFQLNATLSSGETHTLVSRLKHPETARYLKQCIEDALELK